MNDQERYEFYANPEKRRLTGWDLHRKADRLTEVKSVRFSARILAEAQAAAVADDRDLGSWIRKLISFELIRLRRMERERIAREHRPYKVIEGSGRAGTPRTLPSSLSIPRTFACEHMSIGNVVSASCGICGPGAAVS